MSIDDLIERSIEDAAGYEVSPDLFGRVLRSIDEDRAHRARTRRFVVGAVLGAAVCVGWTAIFTDRTPVALVVDVRAFEVLVSAVLLVLIVVMGPAIRRFGAIFVADAFRASRTVAEAFLRVLDVSFYLVLVGYTLVTSDFEAPLPMASLTTELGAATLRIAGLMLLMGVLHATVVVALPFIGLVFTSSSRHTQMRLDGGVDRDGSPEVMRAERIAGLTTWLLVLIGAGVVVAAVTVGALP